MRMKRKQIWSIFSFEARMKNRWTKNLLDVQGPTRNSSALCILLLEIVWQQIKVMPIGKNPEFNCSLTLSYRSFGRIDVVMADWCEFLNKYARQRIPLMAIIHCLCRICVLWKTFRSLIVLPIDLWFFLSWKSSPLKYSILQLGSTPWWLQVNKHCCQQINWMGFIVLIY